MAGGDTQAEPGLEFEVIRSKVLMVNVCQLCIIYVTEQLFRTFLVRKYATTVHLQGVY